MANVLYISHTGMTEALGESQVIQYVIKLAEKNNMSILSFEKPVDLEKYDAMKKRLSALNIDWKYYTYSNRFGLLSTVKQMIQAFFYLLKKIKRDHIEIIHARSLIPAVIGVLAKKIFKIKLLFDIRGFAIDEKIFDGSLSEGTIKTRVLKTIETSSYRAADAIVTLTHISKPIIEKKYGALPEIITVIPTCVNSAIFYPVLENEKAQLKEELGFSSEDFLMLRTGSVNAWCDFASEAKLMNALSEKNETIKFLIVNNSQHGLIRDMLKSYPLVQARAKILSAEYHQMPAYISACDLCLFLVKPVPAKKASAPTKFAEMVACHVFGVTNRGYGDLEYYLKDYSVGALVDLEEIYVTPEKTAEKLMPVIANIKQHTRDHRADYDALVVEHFSKEIAIQKYQMLYDVLA